MLTMRFAAVCVLMSLALGGCSGEKSPSDSDAKKTDSAIKASKSINSSRNHPISVPAVAIQTPGNGKQQTAALPTRSELRVLSEQAKATEFEVKNLIEQFNAGLDNQKTRKDTEARFKQLLPEYKAQMLQIGKAKLKEAD